MTKDEISEVQTLLKALRFPPGKVDGIVGSLTRNATAQFQTRYGLSADGKPGPITLAALRKAVKDLETTPHGPMFYVGNPVQLDDAAFKLVAGTFNIEVAVVRTVNDVEAAGNGFTGDNVKALYEPHVAFSDTSGSIRDELVASELAYPSQGTHPYPKTSYARIDACAAIAGDEVAALSTSWGLGQIMGFNHEACGYPTAVAMVRAFAKGELYQLEGMLNFISGNAAMLRALRQHEWAKFARLYNGKNYAVNKYDEKLAAAYKKFS